MKMFENYRKKMDIWDHTFVKSSSMAFGIFLAGLFPALLNLNKWWWLGIAVVLALKPWHTAYFKK
jgi:hypothetical protein